MINYPITLFFDGECPVCSLEMDHLAERDALKRLVFVDIKQPGFDVAPYARSAGVEPGQLLQGMDNLIHAALPDGSLVKGVKVFRLAYGAVGLGALTAPTALPVIGPLAEAAYAVFARNRYAFSAAFMPLIARVAASRAARRAAACKEGACDLQTPRSTS
jgi:predicted DCC family thiol-disulfide oxidoreductase YuxK